MPNESSRSRLRTLLLAGVSAVLIAVAGVLFPDLRDIDHDDSNR